MRWQHPRRGLLTPAHFLPLAEQSGLTRALTAFVLDRALEEIGGVGRRLGVAVNLGPADLLDFDLPAGVARALERRGCAPERLTLEVTEDLVAADPERTLEVLRRLRALGVRLALDDFGEGSPRCATCASSSSTSSRSTASSCSAWPRRARPRDRRAHHRPRPPAGPPRRRGGRRDRARWEALAAHGCDAAQGDLLSRPLPAEELRAWLAAHSAGADPAAPGRVRD